MGHCSIRKFSRAVCSAVSAIVADVTAASADLRVDTSVVSKIYACIPAIIARTKVAIARKTVALANTVSGRPSQNFHLGIGEGDARSLSALAALDAGNWPSMTIRPDTNPCGGCRVSMLRNPSAVVLEENLPIARVTV